MLHMMKDMLGDEFNRPYGTLTIHSLSVPALKCRAKFMPSLTGRKLEIGHFGKLDLPRIPSLTRRKRDGSRVKKCINSRLGASRQVNMLASKGPAGILDSMSRRLTQRNVVVLPLKT
jgi:hypothetical protein